MSDLAIALRSCALGLLRTARYRKEFAGTDKGVIDLVKSARWHWHWYIRERGING